MFERIDAVAIHVNDWEMSIAWYRDNLDFEPFHVEPEHRFAVLGLAGGGAVVHLVGDAYGPPGGRCAPMIAVDDFDAALARLRGKDVKVTDVVDDGLSTTPKMVTAWPA